MKVFYPVFFCATTFVFFIVQGFADDAPKRPNIVWLVADDMSADLGCYGTPGAISPNIDRLAKEGCRFTLAFTHCPVCAPTRSGLITGVYPTTSGALHMRSTLLKPPPMFTDFLKAAGYHVAWPGKTDFNFEVPKQAFSSTTDWLKNPPPEPFFAYLNIPIPHESQIRASKAEHEKHVARLKPSERHDPAKVLLPPYYPDAPEVRNDVAQYQDLVTAVDYRVGDVLKFLDEHQLADNTLVFFFADHGWGMPRGKRWLYDSGIHSPLIVRWPGHVQPGTTRDDLIAFLDFPATVLAAAGVDKPDNMQGQVFLGSNVKERPYIFAARDRMDEAEDRIRAVRTKQYKYIHNYFPEIPYAQYLNYMDEMPTMKVWRQWHREDKLSGPQKLFFAPRKPAEELYDTVADPYEINDLAESPKHQEALKELRAALDRWIAETHDLGEVPERQLIAQGLVADKLQTEYAARKKLHPPEPPVKGAAPESEWRIGK